MIRDNINPQLLNGFLLTMAHPNSDSYFRSSKPLHNRHSNSSPTLTSRETRTRMKCIRIKRDVVIYGFFMLHLQPLILQITFVSGFKFQHSVYPFTSSLSSFSLSGIRPLTHSLTQFNQPNTENNTHSSPHTKRLRHIPLDLSAHAISITTQSQLISVRRKNG